MHRIVVVLLGFIASTALAVEPLGEARRDAELLRTVVSQDQSDEQSDTEEARREAGEDLFPDVPLPEGERGPREGNVEDAPFVSFRWGGIPYLLNDVPTSAWFAPYVRDAADRGIISGYRDAEGIPTGFFGPGDDVTLEQVAKIAVEAARLDQTVCAGPPQNLTASGTWSSSYIACAEHYGFMVYANPSTDVRRPALRGEVVMTLLQAFHVPFVESAGAGFFKDVAPTSEFATAIETAARDYIVSGYADEAGNPTGLFGPSDSVKRAEIAKMVSVALQVYGT